MQLEHKAATAAVAAGGVIDSDDPYTHWIIASVTGVVDEVDDVIEPGAYTKTLGERRPKVIKDHDWGVRLGRAIEVKELLPGDSALPKTTGQGKPWPAAAGALLAKVRLFRGTKDGDEAAVRWTDEGTEQQFSIGYVVPKGRSTQRGGVRYIHELKCFEISDVLWGAMPLAGRLPNALATKMLNSSDGIADDLDEDQAAQLDDDADTDVDTDVVEIDGKAAASTTQNQAITAAAATTVTFTFPPTRSVATGGNVEFKYDTSPVGKPGDQENWVDKVGGLPAFIRAIAHSLIRNGRSEEQAILIAVGTVKRWARGGGKVSEKTRAKAADALAEWERKKAAAHTKALPAEAGQPAAAEPDPVDLAGWDPTLEVGEHAAHGCAVEVKAVPRLPGTVEERLDVIRDAVVVLLRGAEQDPQPGLPSGTRWEWDYVNVDGTYNDHVVATRQRWDDPTRPVESFRVPYQWGPDGMVLLGDPEPVELTITVTPDPYADDEDAEDIEDSGAGEYKAALTLDSVAPAVRVLTDAATMAARGLRTGTEHKAGRVLSAANQKRLQDALQSLVDVLAAAGVHLGEDGSGQAGSQAPAAAEGKDLDTGLTPIAGLGDLPDPRALVAQLLAEASG